MPPYYHINNLNPNPSPPPTPRIGTTFPPLKYTHEHDHNRIVKREDFEGPKDLVGEDGVDRADDGRVGRGPFDEDDIELQLSSSSSESRGEKILKVLRFSSVLFLGLVLIGASIHLCHTLYTFNTPSNDSAQHYHYEYIIDPSFESVDSEARAPVGFKYKIDTIRHTTLHVPTYPPTCKEAACLIHQVPGQGAQPIGTATILPELELPRMTTMNGGMATSTSPPICVPPHYYPHLQEEDGCEDKIQEEDVEEQKEDQDQSPPICVPPHCYPHGPGETPSICVPPHCYPHPPPGHHHDHDHHHNHDHDHHHHYEQDQIDEADTAIPPPCHPPHCYRPPLQTVNLENESEEVIDQPPPICVPPHCYPHHQSLDACDHHLDHEVDIQEEQEQGPPFCDLPHCEPNNVPGLPPGDCVPPACYPSNPHPHQHHDQAEAEGGEEDLIIQTDQERENEYLASHPEVITRHAQQLQEKHGEDQIHDEEEEEEDKPICMPPICVPRAKSPPVSIPTSVSPCDD